jgi:hypothetical protein
MVAGNNSFILGLPADPPVDSTTELYTQLKLVYTAIQGMANQADGVIGGVISAQAPAIVTGILQQSIPGSFTAVAGETIPANVFVNLDETTGHIRVADANTGVATIGYTSNPRKVAGFVLDSITNGASGIVYVPPLVISTAGLTAGKSYYLTANGSPAGTMYPAPPASGSGYLKQLLGIAISSSKFYFNPNLDPTGW